MAVLACCRCRITTSGVLRSRDVKACVYRFATVLSQSVCQAEARGDILVVTNAVLMTTVLSSEVHTPTWWLWLPPSEKEKLVGFRKAAQA